MIKLLTPTDWKDYELLDSGNESKLERFGQYIVSRPDPRAIWSKGWPETEWKKAGAEFVREGDREDEWKFRQDPPGEWVVSYGRIKFTLKPTDFKHVGVFPEQAVNWEWMREKLERAGGKPRVLNLFAYTGGATMACVLAGAHVTHVDSSRPAMMWASENAKLAGLSKESVRWIQEDALKFVQREVRRGATYEAVIMDPPRFGRGARGEVWKLQERLPELVAETMKLLSPTPVFALVNAYTADMSSLVVQHVLQDNVTAGEIESGELGIAESSKGRVLPAGIFARWSFNQ